MKRKIVFTGGGTAGHVTPNLALIEQLLTEGWQIDYIGSGHGVEKAIITSINIPFHAIRTGKLRRYLSWKNVLDPFNVIAGVIQSFCLLRKLKTDVVFSKGGFVAFPVVAAAWLNRIPVVAHESDISPGLANRLSFPFVKKICVNFDLAKSHFKDQTKIEVTGTPIRSQLFQGSREKGLALCGFTPDKPCLLVAGGSQGAQAINHVLREALPSLTQHYQVIHLCGSGKIDKTLLHQPGYFQFEYANEELPDLFAAADLVISRAGANSLCEILALQKPHILVPLPMKASRGDQIQNAQYFEQKGVSKVIPEENLTVSSLLSAIEETGKDRESISQQIKSLKIESATGKIISIIKEQLHVESPEVI